MSGTPAAAEAPELAPTRSLGRRNRSAPEKVDVIDLATEGIDTWRAATLVIRGKGNRVDTLPLPTDIGEAIAAYLRRSRPSSAEGWTVFVRVRAPHQPLTSSGMTNVVAAAARQAGLDPIHAHRLRHTAA